jgi:hypothetical protein
VHFLQPAQEATNYAQEVEHMAARVARLDLAIEETVKSTPPKMRAVIEALQALRGIAQISAVTIVAELGEVSRFTRLNSFARQLEYRAHVPAGFGQSQKFLPIVETTSANRGGDGSATYDPKDCLEHRRRYGYRRITAELHRLAMQVNHNRVVRIVREDDLLGLQPKRFVVTTKPNHKLKIYLNLAGSMKLTDINQLWWPTSSTFD